MKSKAKRSGRLVLVAMTLGLTAFGTVLAARADCVSAEVYLTRSGSSRIDVVGPKRCVVPTPWNEWMGIGGNYSVNAVPSGSPNGAGASVWLATP